MMKPLRNPRAAFDRYQLMELVTSMVPLCSRRHTICRLVIAWTCLFLSRPVVRGQEPQRERTNFQTSDAWEPALDVSSDVAIVYGQDRGFADRLASWREQGYAAGFMTGIAWGDYTDYFGDTEATFKRDEVQTRKDGSLRMHGRYIGYNVPTPGYIEYLKHKFEPVVDAGVPAIYLEEPEYWADTGWSAAFKQQWQEYYGEPWQEPDSSVDAQYRASRLKYELYYNALREVFRHLKARAASQGRPLECHVPTHSLINYAHWCIVSPESHLMDLPEVDGYIAQVWTGTARTPNVYRGQRQERTFETAFLEYGQSLAMVRPTGRKVWFLADPIEDNPRHNWADYRRNYECTIVASLFWPEQSRFEVMPWPSRIFKRRYPRVDLGGSRGGREAIPADYATEMLTVINALNDMEQDRVVWDCGTRGVGILVSDTMMFQRVQPTPSDPDLSSFYGLALPLLKAGLPVEPVQLETILADGALGRYHTLLLTYEGQKPLRPEYHQRLNEWIRSGGRLLYVGDGSDPYDHVREWWNDQGGNNAGPADDLFARLGVSDAAASNPIPVDRGWVRSLTDKPRELAHRGEGADVVLAAVRDLLATRGDELVTRGYLKLQRGPYVVLAVLDEVQDAKPAQLTGRFVDLFDPSLKVRQNPSFDPGSRVLLYDLASPWDGRPRVIAAAARVRNVQVEGDQFRCVTRGPAGTHCRMRLQFPAEPKRVQITPEAPIQSAWDADSSTLLLEFDNRGGEIVVTAGP